MFKKSLLIAVVTVIGSLSFAPVADAAYPRYRRPYRPGLMAPVYRPYVAAPVVRYRPVVVPVPVRVAVPVRVPVRVAVPVRVPVPVYRSRYYGPGYRPYGGGISIRIGF